jgi:hypothetical protein
MALKDKLGLALIPSAYSGVADENNAGGTLGKVHSVFPKQTTSDNLVTNGTFDTDSDWTKGTGWSIENGVATSTGTAGFTYLQQGNVNTGHAAGKGILTFTISGCTNFAQAGIVVQTSPGASGIARNFNTLKDSGVTLENGVVTFTQFDNYRPNLAFWNNTGSPITIDNVSYKVITDGDFDFSRGSDATRVNKDGYIESVQVLSDELIQNGDFEEVGSELITNGGFDTDSNWNGINANGVSISNGSLNYSNTTLNHNVSQGSVVTIGRPYKLTFTISNYEKGSILPILGAGGSLQEVSGDGTFTMYGTASINTVFYFQARGTDGTTLSIDNISVKEVGQNWEFIGESQYVEGAARIYSSAGVFASIEQLAVITPNQRYRLSYDIISNNGGTLKVNNIGIPSTVGHHTYDFSQTNTAISIGRQSGVTDIVIDNISVKEITDDTDIPRLDYSDGACPTLLLEPQRINYVPDVPSSFVNADWGDDVLSPENKLNGKSFVPNNTPNTTHYISLSSDSTITIPSNSITFSFYAKEGSSSIIRGRFDESSYTERLYFAIDLSNDTFLLSGSASSATTTEISDFIDGWKRVSITVAYTSAATGSQNICYIGSGDNFAVDIDSYTGDGSAFIYFYGFQIEQGSYATSYIPTNGSTVTRLADVCNNAGDSTIFNDDEGVLFVDMAALADDLTFRTVSISDGTTDNRINIRYRTTSNAINGLISGNGSTAFNNNHITQDITEYSKVALKYKSGDIALWVDGVEVLSSTASFNISGLNQISFNRGSSIDLLYGKVKSLLYFDRALTDEELEALTSSRTSDILNDYSTLLSRVGATYESTGLEDELNKTF